LLALGNSADLKFAQERNFCIESSHLLRSKPFLHSLGQKLPFAKDSSRPEADVGISSAFDGWQPPSLIFTFLDLRAIGTVQQLLAFSISD